MLPGAGLVLGLGTKGVATGGGTYPDDTCKEKQTERDALSGGCHLVLVSPPLLLGPDFPTVLPLTRALKGSFLVMSSSSEDRESISRSILLTFSLGWRVRGQSTHPSLPLSPHSRRGGELKTSSLQPMEVSPSPSPAKLPSKPSLPAVGAG